MTLRNAVAAVLLMTTALTPFTSQAAQSTADIAKEIQALKDQLAAMQKQLEALQAREAESREALEREVEAREAATRAAREANLSAGGRNVMEGGVMKMIPPANPKVTQSGTNRFAMSSADNAWTIAPTGRVHFDMGFYLDQDAEGVTGPGTAAGGRLTNGVNARRARLGITGRAMSDFTYSLILDAGGAQDGTAAINEARITYTGMPNTIFEIGYGSQYFPLDEANSSNDIMFLERPSPVTIASSFNAGDPRFSAGMRKWGSNWFVGTYLTASTPNVAHGLTTRGFGAYERVSFNPIQDDLRSVHIGVSAAQVFEAGNTGANTPGSFTLSDRPEVRIDPTVILNTGALGSIANPVTSAQVYGVEAAAAFGSFFMQGEYLHDVVKRRQDEVQVGGGYVQASYTLGGRRTYVPASGAYSGVNPVTPFSPRNGGWGAFEFAARVSYMDLVDNYNPAVLAANQPFLVNGGKQTNYTVGFNWFWNSNMLWKFNFIHTDFEKQNPITAASAMPVPLGLSLDIFAARFQFMF
ncbi:MAG: porin [Rhodospirillaceae bacterium]